MVGNPNSASLPHYLHGNRIAVFGGGGGTAWTLETDDGDEVEIGFTLPENDELYDLSLGSRLSLRMDADGDCLATKVSDDWVPIYNYYYTLFVSGVLFVFCVCLSCCLFRARPEFCMFDVVIMLGVSIVQILLLLPPIFNK